MPTAEFFTQYGLFAVKEFFDREFCAQICAEIEAESSVPGAALKGAVLKQEADSPLPDEEIRRTSLFILSSPVAVRVREKLFELMPRVAEHFALELTGCQTVKFAVYRAGDYFKPHVDVVDYENATREIKERKVSVVIFLNRETAEAQEGTYCGGQLTFYGLMNNSVFADFGLPLAPEPGLFVAFSPRLLHEVTPVTSGQRYVVLTWYT